MKIRRAGFVTGWVMGLAMVGFLTGTGTAFGAPSGGLVLAPADLDVASRSSLVAETRRARSEHPEAAARVRALVAEAPRLDDERRGRFAPMARAFMALGPEALFPMLEILALEGASDELTDSARTSLRVGLLEAVGRLRDERAVPVLVAVLRAPGKDDVTVRAAAAALGRLGTDKAMASLLAAARDVGASAAHRQAVLAGLGECRRLEAATFLASLLDRRPSPVEAAVLARALGRLGSSWAWRAPEVAVHGLEEKATRALSAAALVDAFVAYEGDTRAAAEDALLVVDDPSTPDLLAAAQGRSDLPSPERTRAALAALAARFAQNPAR